MCVKYLGVGALAVAAVALLMGSSTWLRRTDTQAEQPQPPWPPTNDPWSQLDEYSRTAYSRERTTWLNYSQWNSSVPPHLMAQKATRGRQPVVFRDTPASSWPCNQWTREQWCTQVPTVTDTQTSDHSVFWWHDEKREMGKVLGLRSPRNNGWIQTSCCDLLDQLGLVGPGLEPGEAKTTAGQTSTEHRRFMYVSQKTDLDFKPLEKDIGPYHWLHMNETGTENQGILHIWAGQQGVTAHTHYDDSHNWYYQIRGRKRFILSPPPEHPRFYLHAFAHPAYRQSQVDHAWVHDHPEEARKRFPLFGQASAQVVDLEPGSLLYIPPFTLHRVIALTPSLSVNIWSDSMEADIHLLAEEVPLPNYLLTRAHKPRQRDAQLQLLKLTLFQLLLTVGFDRPQAFISVLYEQRYAPLVANGYVCEPHGLKDYYRNVCGGFPTPAKELKGLKPWLKRMDELFRVVSHADFRGTKETVLMSLVEHITNFVVGVDGTCAFLYQCMLPTN